MAESMKEKVTAWHEEGVRVSRSYRQSECRLVDLLSRMDECSGYLLYKCESLRQYAITLWELPENAAADIVTVAKKAAEVPAMIDALREGRATVSKLRKICPVITVENQKDWLDLVEACPKRVVEKAVAMAKPEAAIIEQLEYVAGDRLRLKTEISEELAEKIKRVQDLVSRKMNSNATLWEAIEAMADDYLNRFDPLKKAERSQKRETKMQATPRGPGRVLSEGAANTMSEPGGDGVEPNVTRSASAPRRRSRWQAPTQHALSLRDREQCTYIDANGVRCPNRRYLHIHHVIPVAAGGNDEVENLTTLCSGHHRMVHASQSLH